MNEYECILTGKPVSSCDGCEYQDTCAGVDKAGEA